MYSQRQASMVSGIIATSVLFALIADDAIRAINRNSPRSSQELLSSTAIALAVGLVVMAIVFSSLRLAKCSSLRTWQAFLIPALFLPIAGAIIFAPLRVEDLLLVLHPAYREAGTPRIVLFCLSTAVMVLIIGTVAYTVGRISSYQARGSDSRRSSAVARGTGAALVVMPARLKWFALAVMILVIGVGPLALAAMTYWSRWELNSARETAARVIASFSPPCQASGAQLRCDEEIKALPKGPYSLGATPVLEHGVDVWARYADGSVVLFNVTPSLLRRSRVRLLHVAHAPPILQPTCPRPAPLMGEWKESPFPQEGTRYELRLKEGPGAIDQQRMTIEAWASKYQLARVRPVTSDLIVATGWSASTTPEMLASLRCDERILEVWNMEIINVD
jgi:hypothetical protein